MHSTVAEGGLQGRFPAFCTENPIDPVVNQMEQTFPLNIFLGKKGRPSEVFLFSRFFRNDRKMLFHLLCPTSIP